MSRHLSTASRYGLFAALAVGCANLAQAADVAVTPAAGNGFVVKSALAERFRVNANDGAVILPAVPGAATQPNALCISNLGQLGPCAGGGGGGSYTAGAGLGLAGSVFSIAPTYQLPQSCSTDQIAKWNGSAWVCATPASVGGMPACEGG